MGRAESQPVARRVRLHRRRTVTAMVKPVLLIVDDEPDSLRTLTRELELRYGSYYQIAASSSAEDALGRLEELRVEGVAVPLVLDQWGYVLTGPDVDQHPPLGRARSLLETSMPGVFAVGDVRHGSIKRVASAVGDGSICIRLVHEYLAMAS